MEQINNLKAFSVTSTYFNGKKYIFRLNFIQPILKIEYKRGKYFTIIHIW